MLLLRNLLAYIFASAQGLINTWSSRRKQLTIWYDMECAKLHSAFNTPLLHVVDSLCLRVAPDMFHCYYCWLKTENHLHSQALYGCSCKHVMKLSLVTVGNTWWRNARQEEWAIFAYYTVEYRQNVLGKKWKMHFFLNFTFFQLLL